MKNKSNAFIGGAIAVALLVVFLLWTITIVGKGHVGVVSTFGVVSDSHLDPGLHFVMPWKHVYHMNCQTQKNEEPATVPTKGGLSVKLNAVMLYKMMPAKASTIAKEIGAVGFEEKIIDPYFKNAVRDACANYDPESLYNADRQIVETKVMEFAKKELEPRGFEVESVMLQDPVLPDVVTGRIQAKIAAEQDVQRMSFVLQQKKMEAEAKIVEAGGIAKAQALIKQDLDDNYIRYLWVMALKEHQGAVIYVPTGGDGLPFFKPVHEGKAK